MAGYNLSDADLLPGTRILLVGGRGSGKTAALTELAERRGDAVLVSGEASAHITALAETVAEEISLGIETDVSSRADLKTAVNSAASTFGISHLLEANPLALSGGQTQLVVLAATFVMNAPVLLLDEPLTGLDDSARSRVLTAISAYPGAVVWTSARPDIEEKDAATRLLEVPVADRGVGEANLDLFGSLQPRALVLDDLAISPTAGVGQKRRKKTSLPEPVQANLNLKLEPGEILRLTGPNGAGKTTLLKTIAGLLPPLSGSVTVGGVAPATVPTARRIQLACLAQQNPTHHFLASTIAAEFSLGGAASSSAQERDALLNFIGLNGQLETHPHDLSPVDAHLLALATAAATRASCLLLDEPTGHTDTQGLQQITRLIQHYAQAGGTVIVATHDQELFQALTGPVLQLS